LQLRVELGIAAHVWQEKCDAQPVDALGDEFKPAMPLPSLLMHWVMSLSLQLVGWRTSVRPILLGRLLQKTPLGKALWWLIMIQSGMLIVCMHDFLWWMCRLACFLQ
jgi:hypothetical protein